MVSPIPLMVVPTRLRSARSPAEAAEPAAAEAATAAPATAAPAIAAAPEAATAEAAATEAAATEPPKRSQPPPEKLLKRSAPWLRACCSRSAQEVSDDALCQPLEVCCCQPEPELR